MTASQPFTSALVMSNPNMFSCGWVWEKEQGVNFMMSKKQPMKVHEDILIFSNRQPKYNPIMTLGKPYTSGKGTSGDVTGNVVKIQTQNKGTRYPRSIIKINRETGLHPTQKPVSLFEYLIKTYTNKGDLVLDNCAGSGTTAIACINTNRNYILIEMDKLGGLNKVLQGDCLDLMKNIPDKSIDMILCDLPYGTTACKWDTIIPFEALKEPEYIDIINGRIAEHLTTKANVL